ncbi:hypothetical protein [Thiocystis violascens]|uniref:Uncharacterized protein n=1 Tax=Thiocystis violascens (strain ATCC 17096 / DSM 198 / 6111) TaxID=765911 RepID=I3YEH0_THIV6|nr:hypothetical protein [Thiocystis violascens]AFL75388.1 hypothetical protein Thivi_3521 [Thiocystis violascens DSM 198]
MSANPCAHFVNADGHAACLIGRHPTLDACGGGCPAYLPDAERQPCEVWLQIFYMKGVWHGRTL